MKGVLYMIKTIFYTRVERSYHKMIEFVKENDIDYIERAVTEAAPLTKEELYLILKNTTDGVDEILSMKSKIYKELLESGIDIDDLTMNQLLVLLQRYPTLIKTPIVVGKDSVLVGYNDENKGMLLNRSDKRQLFNKALSRSKKCINYSVSEAV